MIVMESGRKAKSLILVLQLMCVSRNIFTYRTVVRNKLWQGGSAEQWKEEKKESENEVRVPVS